MSNLPLQTPPASAVTLPDAARREIDIVKLAREIAMDLRELSEILKLHAITNEEFERLKRLPYFNKVLTAELEAWQAATNTQERVRLKAAAMMEEYLPELFKRMVDPNQDLMKAVKGAELVTKLAALGEADKGAFDPSNRVVITINMGNDSKLQVSKTLPPQVIDHEPLGSAVDLADELQQNLFEGSIDADLN